MNASNYLGIISSSEIEQLRSARKKGFAHPVAALALAVDVSQVAITTEQAGKAILRMNEDWLSSLKQRLLDTTDFSNASGALGEIRAYGALLETGMTVIPKPSVPGKKVIPEFEVDARDGAVIVEVHSRQLDYAQTQAAEGHQQKMIAKHQAAVQKERATKSGKLVLTTGVLAVAPFGAPNAGKKDDSILTNAISRIASIKQNERQVDPNKPFVLWLDLQDPTVWGLSISEEQLAPLYTESKDGEVGTGALWFALYGRKGDPMIEMEGFDYRVRTMLHNGRFLQTTRVSAVIYSMPCATVLMENPEAAMPIPPKFRASLLKTPFFRLDLSMCEWESGLVRSRVDVECRAVAAAAKALSASNQP
jgi:hypothetical protein